LSLLVVVAFLSVVLPLQIGSDWVKSPIVLFSAGWVSFISAAPVVVDSFAGERERHTLETLLASRLSNQAVLFGKVCTAVSYGWGLTLLTLFLGLVTVNLVHGHGELLLYQGIIGLGSTALSLLGAGLAASAGVLISLRASTVRQAQQTLSFAAWLLPIIVGYGGRIFPVEWRAYLVEAITASGMSGIVFVVTAILIVLDIGLLVVAMARFQRARLILD
jgi:ABC-2 type transport system permease protein